MLTCFQAAGSATCTGVKGKETHKEEEKKQRNSFELSHPSWLEEKPQFPSLSPQPSKLWGAVLLPPGRLPAVPQVIHDKSLPHSVTSPKEVFPKKSASLP